MPNKTDYTEEQIKDISDREKKCLDFLKENQLNIAISMQFHNIGNDVFGIRPIPFLQDMKYKPVVSPIQQTDLKKPDEPISPTA
jgi:hypothetical protein